MENIRRKKLQELLNAAENIIDCDSEFGRSLLESQFDPEDPLSGTAFDCDVLDAIENNQDIREALSALLVKYD